MLVTIASYSFPYEAHIARAKLDSEGIPAFVADEHTINMNWLYSNALGGVRLQVPAEFVEEAQKILAEERQEALEELDSGGFGVCPYCQSEDTEYYRVGRRIALLVFLGINFPLFPTSDGIKCNSCGKVSKT